MSDTRGVSLVMALAATALAGSLTLLGLRAAMVRVRLASDSRWRTEGELVVATALATARIAHRAQLDSIADGDTLAFAPVLRPDGWAWRAQVMRSGTLIRVVAVAWYGASDGTTYAARRASLMLARDPADTVRVLGQRARF